MNWRITGIAPVAVLALGLVLSAGPAAALGFNWSFFDTGTSETISGMVTGLTDNATTAASSVMITDDAGLSFILPQETLGGVVNANSWTVLAGAITSVEYSVSNFAGAFSDYLVMSGGVGPFSATLYDDFLDDIRTGVLTFTPKDVPEPATALLVAAGLLGLALRRRLA